MAIKVLITRRFKEGKIMEVLSQLNQLRSKAMDQAGYITGETLIGHDDPQKLVIISTWQSAEDWLKWKSDPDRKAVEEKLEPYLEVPAKIEAFTFGTIPKKKG